MLRKVAIIGAALLYCSSSYALDLQREELLNLYHGVESSNTFSSSALTGLSNGLVPNLQQGNEHDEIEFAPLPLEEPQTTFGVFTSDSLNEDISNRREFEYKTPKQFGHNESESVGVYIKKSF